VKISKIWLTRLVLLGLASTILVSCSSNDIAIIDNAPVDGKRLSFPPAFYQNIVYIDGRLLGFTFSLVRESANRVSYAYEGDSALHPFDPLHAKDCPMFIGYVMKGLLPDGRIGFLGCGEGSRWSIFALNWQTGEVERLVKGPLVEYYSSKDFTWNPQMTRGVQEMVDAAQGTIYWITPEGSAPMDVEIEDQGLKWNLKDYYEHNDSFEPGIGYVLSPAWSPDGKTIAFFASTYGMRETPRLRGNMKFELYFMDPSELKPVQVLRKCLRSGRIRLENDQIQPNLPDRLEVYRMDVDCGILSAEPNGTPSQMGNLANHQCDPICEPHRVSVAHDAHEPAALAKRVWIFLALDTFWTLGTYQ